MSFVCGNQEWKKRKSSGRKPRAQEDEIKRALEKAMPSAEVLEKLGDAIRKREGWAIQLYLAYHWGKPVEKHELSGADGDPIRVVLDE